MTETGCEDKKGAMGSPPFQCRTHPLPMFGRSTLGAPRVRSPHPPRSRALKFMAAAFMCVAPNPRLKTMKALALFGGGRPAEPPEAGPEEAVWGTHLLFTRECCCCA